MKQWGLFLLGAGIGAVFGVRYGESVTVPALIAVVVGLFLLARGTRSREPVGDATAATDGTEAPNDRPTLSGLGHRVEHILQLAEEQAADIVAQANIKAVRIVDEARAEADRLKPE